MGRLHPADAERFRDTFERAVAERAPQVEQEYRFQLQDGYHWLYSVTRLVYGEDGELADTLGYAMDVTERRQADEAVREREATLQAVVKASPDIISILDAEGRVRSMSPVIERITGRRADDGIGHNAFSADSIHPDDLEPFHVLGDRQRLKQVLLNLLSNAVKYNRDGGRTKPLDVKELLELLDAVAAERQEAIAAG